jgi:acyl-CoA reductase-like NAD-dependent aldehyde dehydrogenase
VLSNVDHGMAMMREETFGPLLPVMKFRTEDEAVALANDSRYGLSAVVYGSAERAGAVARRLDAGGVSINRWAVNLAMRGFEQHAFGESGFGYNRMGREGYRRFLRSKSIVRYEGTDDENEGVLAREAFGG